MTDSPFKGSKYDTIALTMEQVIDLARDGRSVARFGTWEDGTPAFIAITTVQDPSTSQAIRQHSHKGRDND